MKAIMTEQGLLIPREELIQGDEPDDIESFLTRLHPHITRTSGVCGGRPVVRGTRLAVSALVMHYQNGLTIDEILDGFPFLTPAQLHDALSFYYDHQDEIDQEITASRDEERWKAQYPPGRRP